MKVCFVGFDNLPVLAREYGELPIGGEQVQQTLLARALSRRGFDASMVVYDYGQPDGATYDGVTTFRSFRQAAGIPVFRFLHPRLTSLWSCLKRADADAYYVSTATATLGQVVFFAKRHKKRVIFRVAHDRDCEPDALLIKYYRDKKLYEYGLRRADAILVQGERQQQAMLRNYGLSSSVARMLVDPGKLNLDFAAREIDLLWVNNLRDFKRPDRFLTLASSVPSLKCHMIGGRQAGHERLFDQTSEGAEVLSNLTFHGQIPYHDVNDFYERSRVFVNTSDSEGFPNSYLQAWIRGMPVVAFFDPDGVIAREGLGFAVSSDEEMRQAVQTLTTDSNTWHTFSERCREYMQTHYGDELTLAPYLAALRGELPSPRGSGSK